MLSKPITEARMEYGSFVYYLGLTHFFPMFLGILINGFCNSSKYNVTKIAKVNDT